MKQLVFFKLLFLNATGRIRCGLIVLIIGHFLTACTKEDTNPVITGNTGGNSGTGSPTTSPTVTYPSTIFIASQDYTVSSFGSYWVESFIIASTTSFVFRFASQYKAQAAIISKAELTKFQNISS